MFQRLRKRENDVAAAERRLAARKRAVTTQTHRTGEAVKARLARPDALVLATGLGALYGLWVTRPVAVSSESSEKRARRSLPIPGWLVRTALTMITTRLFAESAVDEAVSEQAASDPPDIDL